MTKEQIAALIAAKIAGQGSMVDIGGALPEILTALAENGISTDMTVAEQMQARKDLGLYYEETTTGEKEVVSDGVQDSKLSDDAPSKDDIVEMINAIGMVAQFTITDIENGYRLDSSGITPFYVITDGDNKGIYCGSLYSLSWKLVYNGETTVISKVPEKFLPEQESGGGALPWLDLTDGLDIPSDGDNINLSSMISQADWEKLIAGEYAGIHTPENVGSLIADKHCALLYSRKGLTGWASIPALCVFSESIIGWDAGDGVIMSSTPRFVFIVGSSINNVSIKRVSVEIPGPVELSALPEASMTTQEELDAIGLTVGNIAKLAYGQATGLVYNPGGAATLCGIHYIQDVGVMGKYIEFENFDMIYNITIPMAGSITVTVTQKS